MKNGGKCDKKTKKKMFSFIFIKTATIVEPYETGIYPKSNSFNRHAETLSENHDTLLKSLLTWGKPFRRFVS